MKLVAANRSHYWSSAINLKSRETECADRDAVRGIDLSSCRAKLPPPNSLPSPSQLRPYAQLAGAKSHTERPIQSARGGPPCGSRPTGRSGLRRPRQRRPDSAQVRRVRPPQSASQGSFRRRPAAHRRVGGPAGFPAARGGGGGRDRSVDRVLGHGEVAVLVVGVLRPTESYLSASAGAVGCHCMTECVRHMFPRIATKPTWIAPAGRAGPKRKLPSSERSGESENCVAE